MFDKFSLPVPKEMYRENMGTDVRVSKGVKVNSKAI